MRLAIASLLPVAAVCALAATTGKVAWATGSTGAVEDLGNVEVVSPDSSEGKPRGAADLVGRLHPTLVHFPIAGLVGLTLVELAALARRRESWRQAGLVLLVATAISVVPTVATGLLRAAHMNMDAAEHALLVRHRALNLTVTGLVLAALVLRLAHRRGGKPVLGIAYLVLVLAATGLVLVAADFGGRMVYGPDYLPF